MSNAAEWMLLGGDPMHILGTKGVDYLVMHRILELAVDKRRAFLDSFYSNIASSVNEGVVKAFSK